MDLEPESSSHSSQNPRPAAAVDSAASALELNLLADKLLAEHASGDEAEKSPKPQSKTYKHPMAIDLLLAIGLLFAMAGLTVSFVKTYITHSAKTSILQGNYKAAIGILHGSPIPEFFGGAGTDNSEDLLNQALYLDAMEKLDSNRDDQTALQELSKVKATQGSYYYDLAQDQFRKLKMQGHFNATSEDINRPINDGPINSNSPANQGAPTVPQNEGAAQQQPSNPSANQKPISN